MFTLAVISTVFVNGIMAETTTASGQCEDYGEKVTEGWETSTLARDDPCFGYGYSCCTETYSEYCYWKDTYNCNNCELDIGYGGCNACCDSYDNTESPTMMPTFIPSSSPTEDPTPSPSYSTGLLNTPSPTMHSAKKWEMMHPSYKGGDGELLWNIYYGDFSKDERFDSFRKDQLWDAQVIRPIIEEDIKYERFQLAHQSVKASHTSRSTMRLGDHQWLIMASILIVMVAAASVWYKRSRSYTKVVASEETDQLIKSSTSYGSEQ